MDERILHRLKFQEEEILADLLAFYVRSNHPETWEHFLATHKGQARRDKLNETTDEIIDLLLERFNE